MKEKNNNISFSISQFLLPYLLPSSDNSLLISHLLISSIPFFLFHLTSLCTPASHPRSQTPTYLICIHLLSDMSYKNKLPHLANSIFSRHCSNPLITALPSAVALPCLCLCTCTIQSASINSNSGF